MADDEIFLTQKFNDFESIKRNKVNFVLSEIYNAMLEKGYNPVRQIVGYILSGDPTYITSHKGARNLINKIERDELLEEIVKVYLENYL